QLVGSRDPRIEPSETSPSVELTPAVAPDGRLLLLGRSVRHPPDWLIGLDVVDVASGRLVRSFEFGRRPSSASNQGASASAPSSPVATPRVVAGAYASPPQAPFSSDGRHVVLSLT